MNASTANRLARWVLFATALASFYLFIEAIHFGTGSIHATVASWMAGDPAPVPVDWTGLLSSAFLFPLTYLLSPLLLGTVHGLWDSAIVAYPGLLVALTLFAIGADRQRRERREDA